MTDIQTIYDPNAICCDWKTGVGDLSTGDDLQTAIILSLFTDRVANADDEHEGDRRGWWGDKEIGSRFWLLRRQKLTKDVVLKVEEYAKEALYWLIDDGVVKSIHIDARRRDPHFLFLTISYVRNKQKETMKFHWQWEQGEGNVI